MSAKRLYLGLECMTATGPPSPGFVEPGEMIEMVGPPFGYPKRMGTVPVEEFIAGGGHYTARTDVLESGTTPTGNPGDFIGAK